MNDLFFIFFSDRHDREGRSGFTRKLFFHPRFYFVFMFVLFLGFLSGVFLSLNVNVFDGKSFIPLLFSGIPSSEANLFSCFSTYLLSAVIALLSLFVLGTTVFGLFAVPLFVFMKGMLTGLAMMFYFSRLGFEGLVECSLLFTPVASVSAFIILLFAVRSFIFSNGVMKLFFSRSLNEKLNLHAFFMDLVFLLLCAVLVSLSGCALAFLYSVFFH